MSGARAYLDHNATSPLRPEARAAVLAALDLAGNASAVHAEGRAARKIIEQTRTDLAAAVGADPKGVVFTSGATEAAATVLQPGFGGAARLIVSSIEHSAVLSGGRFAPNDVSVCPVGADGRIDLRALADLLAADPRPAMVAVMAANNETGVVQPVRAAADLVHAAGGVLVCDAVQGLGKLDIDMAALGADALILSGHKAGAPQGVGALVVAGARWPGPLLRGGGQESRRRAGTENVAGIAGFGAAVRALRENPDDIRRITGLRDWMEQRLRTISPDVIVIGGESHRLGNTSLVALPGMTGETAVIAFDLAGVSVATGSACASGKVSASHVLAAMGVAHETARAAVRVSLGWTTTEAHVEQFLAVWSAHASRVLARRGQAA